MRNGDDVVCEFNGCFDLVRGVLVDHYHNESGTKIINASIKTRQGGLISGVVAQDGICLAKHASMLRAT